MDFSIIPSRYEFNGEIHSGGQGNVYVFHDQDLNRLVAIKEANRNADQDTLLNEIRALSGVASKHVVELYDVLFKEGMIAAIVVEYISGDDLTPFANEPISEEDFLKTLYQVSAGIADMHASVIVHRDIKHNNMKRDAEGIVKIFDFGLAKDYTLDAITLRGHGTHGYRAPELCGAFPAPFGLAVDTYAFGALCWWLLEGDFPHELKQIPPQADSPVPSISSSTSSLTLPTKIVSVIDDALSVDPARRPMMADVRDALAQQLLYGRHRAHLSAGDNEYHLERPGQRVRVKIPGKGAITVRYDGFQFLISDVEGDVFINNGVARSGQLLPAASVITIGGQDLGSKRVFVAFNISHPEVVL